MSMAEKLATRPNQHQQTKLRWREVYTKVCELSAKREARLARYIDTGELDVDRHARLSVAEYRLDDWLRGLPSVLSQPRVESMRRYWKGKVERCS